MRSVFILRKYNRLKVAVIRSLLRQRTEVVTEKFIRAVQQTEFHSLVMGLLRRPPAPYSTRNDS